MKWKPKVQFRDPSTLIPYSKNAKVHTKDQINKVAGSISAFGFTAPILIDKEGVIIAGHCRREASIALNMNEVPVVVADHLDEYQIMALRIADNKVAESPWDMEFLKFDLGTLKMQDFKIDLTGFDLPEIHSFLDNGEIPSGIRIGSNTNENIERVNKGNENEEWVDMPKFEESEKDIKLTIKFESEEARESFVIKNSLEIDRKMNGQWTSNL